jgi:neutral ceramidase
MQYWEFELPNGTAVQTCPAALGYSFAAGTTDGPGPFDFTQGDSGKPSANPLWTVVRAFIKTPSEKTQDCHQPKPILLDVGEISSPYAWSPNIIDVQLMRVGQFIMIISPSEVTTMSGRRWKSAVASAAVSQGIISKDPIVVVGSPANTYAHYLTTPEEYDIQRYEGASTLYGKWQLPAFMNLSISNIGYLAADAKPMSDNFTGSAPPDNSKSSLNFITSVVVDSAGIGKSFGQVLTQPNAAYHIGDVVNATFVAANPRNNLRLEGSFTAVEQLVNGQWVKVRDDWDWFLSLTWKRVSTVLGTSTVVLSWETESDAEPGTYRLHYYGDSKSLFGSISAFEGVSNSFTLS